MCRNCVLKMWCSGVEPESAFSAELAADGYIKGACRGQRWLMLGRGGVKS